MRLIEIAASKALPAASCWARFRNSRSELPETSWPAASAVTAAMSANTAASHQRIPIPNRMLRSIAKPEQPLEIAQENLSDP